MADRPASGSDLGDDDRGFIQALSSAIGPYLGHGYSDLALVAEFAGMSKRTLQRRLQSSGRAHSEVVEEARFAIARGLLSDTSLKIIDVAFAAGYENPQHFSRAFRRFAGVTPTTFRNDVLNAALTHPSECSHNAHSDCPGIAGAKGQADEGVFRAVLRARSPSKVLRNSRVNRTYLRS